MEEERKGKHLATAGTKDWHSRLPTIQCINFLRPWAFKHGFRTLAKSAAAMHAPTACLRAKLVSLGPDVHQALPKACFGACAEAD